MFLFKAKAFESVSKLQEKKLGLKIISNSISETNYTETPYWSYKRF